MKAMKPFLFVMLSCLGYHYTYSSNRLSQNFVTLKGYCYDRFTGEKLHSKIMSSTNGNEKVTSNIKSAEFNVQISRHTKFIVLQCDGYKTLTMPVSYLGAIKDGVIFDVKIPMIALNFKQEKHNIKFSNTPIKENHIPVSFVSYDALNNVPIPCEVCFATESSPKFNCKRYDLNGDKMTITVPASKQLKMTVKANGYEDYSSKISMEESGNEKQKIEGVDVSISLFRIPNVLSSSFDTPSELRLFCNMQDMSKKAFKTSFNFAKKSNSSKLVIEDPVPGQYRFTLTDGKGLENSNLLSENLSLKPGLNLLYIRPSLKVSREEDHDDPKVEVARTEPKLPNRTEAAVFFDQSMYDLKEEARITLDSVARYLSENQSLFANVRGYTDGVGNRKLNEYLAENRVRIVVSYLEKQGIERSRMLINRKVEVKADEETSEASERKKNRKVTIIFERK